MTSLSLYMPLERQPSITTFDTNFRMTTPAENYRCPVSTPANNFVQKQSRIRRTKPLTVVYSQPTMTSGRGARSKGLSLARHSRPQQTNVQPLQAAGQALDYYFVDKRDDQKAEEQTNTHWLKALCSQPVEEILKKYRRKSDVKRTRIIWSKTFTTPGERSLLQAWSDHNPRCRIRSNQIQSAMDDPVARRLHTGSITSAQRVTLRHTLSEPPMSRAQNNLDLVSGTVTPVTVHREEQDVRHCFIPRSPRSPIADDGNQSSKFHHTVLAPADHSPRVRSYTTQYFAPKSGITGAVRVKVVSSPEHLPVLCVRNRVASMVNSESSANES